MKGGNDGHEVEAISYQSVRRLSLLMAEKVIRGRTERLPLAVSKFTGT